MKKSNDFKLSMLLFVGFSTLSVSVFGEIRVVNFDDVPAAGIVSGSRYSNQGVTFSTVTMPDNIIIGQHITPVIVTNSLYIEASGNSISSPMHAFQNSGFGYGDSGDILMYFSPPVTSVQLQTDKTSGEVADVVRLISLVAASAAGSYEIIAFTQALDNAVSAPANTLRVDAGGKPFSYAIFQNTTEGEGVDNVTFDIVPLIILSENNGMMVWATINTGKIHRLDWAPSLDVPFSSNWDGFSSLVATGVINATPVPKYFRLSTP